MLSFKSFVDRFLAASLKEFKESEKRFNEVQEIENGYLKIKALSALKPYHSYRWGSDSKFPPGFRVPVTYLYDEQGRPHRWTIFVYSGGGGPAVELTAREIMKKTVDMAKEESGAHSASRSESVIGDKTLVDIRCSVCDVLRSAVPTLDVRKAEKALKEAGSVNALLSYYNSRCPEGGLHAYQSGVSGTSPDRVVCAKCGRVDNLKPGSKEAADYYKKYLPNYKESVDTIDEGKVPIEVTHTPSRAASTAAVDSDVTASKFEYDYDVIVRASKLAGVPIRAVETIGMSEKLEYSQLVGDPKYLEDYLLENPFKPEDDRTAKADSALRAFAVHYNFARFYFRLSRVARETRAAQITTLLKNSGLPQYEHERLHVLLPPPESLGLGATYSAVRDALEYRAAKGEIQAIDVHRFVIQSICSAATKIADIGGKTSGGDGTLPKGLTTLAKSLAVEGLKSIVRSDELFGKAGRFNFNIFGGETTTENPQDSRGLLAAPAGAPAEDEGEDLPDADTEPDQIYESFSYDGMDYDGYNDEPQ